MSSNPFKSIKQYTVTNDSVGVTINGSGIVFVLKIGGGNTTNTSPLLSIDGTDIYLSRGDHYVFGSSVKIFTSNYTSATITASVALFND